MCKIKLEDELNKNVRIKISYFLCTRCSIEKMEVIFKEKYLQEMYLMGKRIRSIAEVSRTR